MKAKSSSNKTNLETYTARIVALGLLAACLLLALTGCQHESTANPGPDPAGAYALISVDGKTVPCTINHEGTAMTVKSGTFVLTADGHCTSTIVISVASRKDATCVTKASYTQSGSDLTMRWEGAGTTTGQLDGLSFTMTNEGMVFAYRK